VLFDTIYKRSEKHIHAKQQQVKAAAEAASVIVAERDRVRSQIAKLKASADGAGLQTYVLSVFVPLQVRVVSGR
jgi:hypothetical protein